MTNTDNVARYQALFEEQSAGLAEPAWLVPHRRAAIERFASHGFPSRRHEEWRYSKLQRVAQRSFGAADADVSITPEQLSGFSYPGVAGHRIVFVNGHFDAGLSQVDDLGAGVELTPLRSRLAQPIRSIAESFDKAPQDHPFRSLNGAFFADGMMLHIDANTTVEAPIELLSLATRPGVTFSIRHQVVLEQGSRATVIETTGGVADGYLSNTVTDIRVAANAQLDHYKLQRDSDDASHFAYTSAHQGRDSRYANHFFSFGGGFVRNELEVELDAEGIETTLNGLYLVDGERHVDNDTLLHHRKPHCNSFEVYRGILDDSATGVFSGKIFVYPDAQKTDAKQSNDTLLLSPRAEANTRPRLEIYADDVRCTHGATIGQLDNEALFYLRSRGIGAAAAQRLLVRAFADELVEQVQVEPLRDSIEQLLSEHLARGTQA